jgi:hypothetical protein
MCGKLGKLPPRPLYAYNLATNRNPAIGIVAKENFSNNAIGEIVAQAFDYEWVRAATWARRLHHFRLGCG